MTGGARYDRIGLGYSTTRRPDPRIEQLMRDALGDAHSVVNVGAGAGSYEPDQRAVVAVEPSLVMARQRPGGTGPVIAAVAEDLPFSRLTFDAAMAVLTVHHWSDPHAGLGELRRVAAGPVVVLSFDHRVHSEQWLVTDYLPQMAELDRGLPSPEGIAQALGGGTVQVVPVPADCVDGFCHAFWSRPDAYLDPAVRDGISGIARLPTDLVAGAMSRLAEDLLTGRWHDRHAELLGMTAIDAGYRLVVSP